MEEKSVINAINVKKQIGDIITKQDFPGHFLVDATKGEKGAVTDIGSDMLDILDALPFYVLLVDEDHHIQLANQAVRNLLGLEPNQIVGGYCPKMVHQCDHPIPECPVEEAVAKGHSVEKEMYDSDHDLWLKSGAYKTRYKTQDGKEIYFHMVRNITERKNALDELKKYQHHLEELVAQRTAELEKANKELESSNEIKDLFSDIIRHDLLNPIGSIKASAEMLMEDNMEDEDVTSILRNSQKAVELIENATMLSHLESMEDFKKDDIDLMGLVENLISDLTPIIGSSEMQIVNNMNSPTIIKANHMIEHVFINFLTNAVKYAAQGKKVVIDANDLGKMVKISFKDFGDGIPDEDKKELFTRFKRTHKGSVKGSGLGLAIAKKLVSLHEGQIWIEDNPHGGAVFVVELPKGTS